MNLSTVEQLPQPVTRFMWRYGAAVVMTLLAIWGRTLLHPWLRDQCPFSLFYLSVLTTAWIAGTGPAVFSIILGTLAAAHLFVKPESSLLIDDVPDLVQLSIYVIVNVVATLLFNRLERQRYLAERRSSENESLSQSLRAADQRKDEFLALLAHELRNPLAPIRSSLALLDIKSSSPDAVNRAREVIQRQTNNLVRITDDLLDVSRFSRGMVELQKQRLDLHDAIADAVEMTEGMFREKSHRFHLLVPDTPVMVEGDRVRLAQLTANLLDNAAKYTPSCGRINLQVEREANVVSISVSDNGIGFSPAEADRLLEPFMQVDASRTREYGGLGVGLTIVNRLASLHGGQLTLSSRGPGLGSCFTVTLPELASVASLDSNKVAVDSPDRTTAAANTTAAKGRKLLIVEDNHDASSLLAELFELEGFVVRVARDGIEALQEAGADPPDIVISDIGLPGMDGFEIARRLRRSTTTARLRLIALTGWGGPADRELAIRAGFDVHLVKPIAFRELLRHVHGTASATNAETRQAELV